MISVDVTAADMLVELDEELESLGIKLGFAEMKDPVKDKLKRFGIYDRFSYFPTLGSAVSHYRELHDVAWSDWEER